MLPFFLCCFSYFIFVLIFVSLITVCLSVFLLRFILPGTLHFLDLVDYILSHVREVFSYYLFKYFLRSFLYFPSGAPKMQRFIHSILSQRSLRLSLFLFILFSVSCFVAMISAIQSSRSFIRSSASVTLLLILSTVLFISVGLFFSSSRSLANIFFASSPFYSEILDHLHDYSES